MYKPVVSVLSFIVKRFNLLKTEGFEHIPKNSAFVVACTHIGWVDVVMLSVAMKPHELHYMAKKELFNNAFLKKLMPLLNTFPVNRENPGPSSLKIPIKLLKENKNIGIFPSGKRTSEDAPLKKGAATIAVKGNVPLLPAYYIGPRNFSDIFKGQKGLIRFGEPIQLDQSLYDKKVIIDETMKKLEEKMKHISH